MNPWGILYLSYLFPDFFSLVFVSALTLNESFGNAEAYYVQ